MDFQDHNVDDADQGVAGTAFSLDSYGHRCKKRKFKLAKRTSYTAIQ